MAIRPTRREFLGAALLVALDGARGLSRASDQTGPSDLWKTADEVLARIAPPRFPDRTFNVTRFGANTTADATAAFRAAIDACARAGGGRVTVPKGRFETGAIHLRSRVNLHLEDGATIAFSRDPKQYLPLVLTRYEGVELMNYSPFIYALETRDVAITGTGTLDGQADEAHWWNWRGAGPAAESPMAAARARLFALAARGEPVDRRVFGDGQFLRPVFVQTYRCQNVLIEGVTIVNSPMWELNPVLCRNVIVRGVTIRSHGPNNDGCDPESCRDVLIERCTFDTGDDCIALKSGRNEDGRRLDTPIENVVVRDCEMRDGHGGVVIGSEISGGARNIFAERCRMNSPRLDRVLRFKTNSVRGGIIERVGMRQITVGQVAEAIVAADFYYEEGDAGAFTPVLRDVEIRNVSSRRSKHAFLLRGYARSPITNIRARDCVFDGVESPDVLEAVRDLVLTNVHVNGELRRSPPW
ncbi:MAG TPA: glycoside hydrolase family 28 protein [Vicinamibacterales bacterium]